MMANCCRFCGLESTLAPTSMRMVAVPVRSGKDGGESGTIHAGNRAQHHLGGGHGGAGIAGGDEACSALPRAPAAGRRAWRSHAWCAAWAAFSCMPMTSVALTRWEVRCQTVEVELGADDSSRPTANFHVVMTRCEDGAFYFRLGRAVSAHGIKSDDGRHCQWEVRKRYTSPPA